MNYDPTLADFDELAVTEQVETQESKDSDFKAQLGENTNPRNDASSIYMREIGAPELLDFAGEIETTQLIERHKASMLLHLLLIPSINTYFVEHYRSEKKNKRGHPKIQHYGNSTETNPFSRSITSAVNAIESVVVKGVAPLSGDDITYVKKVVDKLIPNNKYVEKVGRGKAKKKTTIEISDVDYDFYSLERFLESGEEDSIPKNVLAVLKKLFPIFRFNIDYQHIRKTCKRFTEVSEKIKNLEGRIVKLNSTKLKIEKPKLVAAMYHADQDSFGLDMQGYSDEVTKRLNFYRNDLNVLLAELGCDYSLYKKSLSKINSHRLQAESAISEMVQCNLRLVLYTAKDYSKQTIEFMDFVQEGNIGLIRAVEKYDYRRGYKFSTYSSHWIRQGISRTITDQSGGGVRFPVHMIEIAKRVDKYIKSQCVLGHPVPSSIAISNAIGESVDKVDLALRCGRESVSFETPVSTEDSDGSRLIQFFAYDDDSTISTPTSAMDNKELKDILFECIGRLHNRDGQVMIMRSGILSNNPRTLEETGIQFGVTRERIRQLECKAMGRLKEMLIERGISLNSD